MIMSGKGKEAPSSGEYPLFAFRDMDDLARLSPAVKELYILLGGVEGLERHLKNPDPSVRRGASIVIEQILLDLTRH